MRSIWKGVISFGLVTIPVRLFAATESRGVSFNQLHEPCNARIRYIKRCSHCDQEVDSGEIVRGYQYAPDQYVIVSDKDLENLPLASLKQIRILDFIPLEEIDAVYYKSLYYLAPDELGARAYHLLTGALNQMSRAAVSQIALRQKEHLAVVRPYGPNLVLHTMHYADEIRDMPAIDSPKEGAVPEREMELAQQLIGSMTTSFEPGRYQDDYAQALRQLIAARVEGRETVDAPAIDGEPVMDLARALEQSLAQSPR